MVNRLGVCLLLVVLSGCAGSPTKGQLSSEWTTFVGQFMAVNKSCELAGLFPADKTAEAAVQVMKLNDVYESDGELFTREGNKFMQTMATLPDLQVKGICRGALAKYPERMALVEEQYQYAYNAQHPVRHTNHWTTLLEPLADTMESLGSDAQTMGANAHTHAQGQSEMDASSTGSTGNETQSVLINTDDGLVQCQVTDSGYTFCN